MSVQSIYNNSGRNTVAQREYLRLIGIQRCLARRERGKDTPPPRFIDRKYLPYVFIVVMALGMEFCMSLYFTSIFSGFAGNSLPVWLKNFAGPFLTNWVKMFTVGLLAALPASFLVTMCARRIIRKVFRFNS